MTQLDELGIFRGRTCLGEWKIVRTIKCLRVVRIALPEDGQQSLRIVDELLLVPRRCATLEARLQLANSLHHPSRHLDQINGVPSHLLQLGAEVAMLRSQLIQLVRSSIRSDVDLGGILLEHADLRGEFSDL